MTHFPKIFKKTNISISMTVFKDETKCPDFRSSLIIGEILLRLSCNRDTGSELSFSHSWSDWTSVGELFSWLSVGKNSPTRLPKNMMQIPSEKGSQTFRSIKGALAAVAIVLEMRPMIASIRKKALGLSISLAYEQPKVFWDGIWEIRLIWNIPDN